MKNKNVSFAGILSVLLVTVACSLIGSQPQAQEPTSSIYATAITAGGTHACALLNNSKVKCWGDNASGQLGDGTYKAHNAPVEVPGLDNVVAISAGGEHTCAVLSDGKVKCWGDNASGQLGDGTKQQRLEPVSVPGLSEVVSISAGSEHTCAILKDGRAMCWGKNLYGRVGNGSNTRLIPTPTQVVDLPDGILDIAAGNEHTCALISSGGVKCWGHNTNGQIGDGTSQNRTSPADVTDLGSGAKFVSTGYSTSCAVTKNDSVLCWGWSGRQDYYTSPQEINGLRENVTTVAVGADHICGLTADGAVKCQGENEYGQLGNGTTSANYSAKSVSHLGSVKAIAANFYYTCALISNGTVSCWGDNEVGQLGNGTLTNSSTPVEVSGLIQ